MTQVLLLNYISLSLITELDADQIFIYTYIQCHLSRCCYYTYTPLSKCKRATEILWRFGTLTHRTNISYMLRDGFQNEWKMHLNQHEPIFLEQRFGRGCRVIDLWSFMMQGMFLYFILCLRSVIMVTVFNLSSVKLQTWKLKCYIRQFKIVPVWFLFFLKKAMYLWDFL